MRADGNNLYIEVVPTGYKYWWLIIKKKGKQTKVCLGKYPDISLKEAGLYVMRKREQYRSLSVVLLSISNFRSLPGTGSILK